MRHADGLGLRLIVHRMSMYTNSARVHAWLGVPYGRYKGQNPITLLPTVYLSILRPSPEPIK